jgi:POT family proton-dependent oligopeptide transporter
VSRPALDTTRLPQFAGHPAGLFVLFFAEMWERFSYYGMRALLVLYMSKGFLRYDDTRSYAVYSAYTALVYATPFIGGSFADRLLGQRRAVVLGGLLMAAGHLMMTLENQVAFFLALALLICGNGFFKPNISTVVGALYPEGSKKRDGGFTIFYMGINLGAALAPLVCGYIGETYGWHYGFGLATIGMLVGLAVFVAPTRVTQALISLGSLACAVVMLWGTWGNNLMVAVNTPVALALLCAAAVAVLALQQGPLPAEAGAPPSMEALKRPIVGPITAEWAVYGGTLLAVPLIAMLVQRDQLASALLWIFGLGALGYLLFEAVRSVKVERERLFAVLVMMFFSMLFWAFFEQAGSSINNFTDRNVDRVIEDHRISAADVGKPVDLTVNQEQLGYRNGGATFTLDQLDEARTGESEAQTWTITQDHVGMGVGGDEIPASVFQATNPIFILLFGLVFTAAWGWLGKRGAEPNTAVKFGLGLAQLAAGFGVLWWGAHSADGRGMVGMTVLVLAYLLHTTGELCLSPVGLSMVTRLSPPRIVSMVMGAWFLATAFSQDLAGVIAKLTAVGGEEEGGNVIPAPSETLGVYGDVFGQIGVLATISAVLVLALSPLLTKWMHEEESGTTAGGGH